jgi:hypothetical protein
MEQPRDERSVLLKAEIALIEHFQEKWNSGFPSENATMQK